MRTGTLLRRLFAQASLAAALVSSPQAFATEAVNYSFSAAAQEITQLFWLAETAQVCGWATNQEAERFEQFAVRFIAAHLQGTYQVAFKGMVGDERYLTKVRKVAAANASDSCKLARWQHGWTSYKAAAEENDGRY